MFTITRHSFRFLTLIEEDILPRSFIKFLIYRYIMQYIIASLVALAATVAASPVGQLEARQTACYIPPTAPVTAGSTTVTLTGPFKLKSSSTSTNPKASGKYAHYKQYIPGGDNTGTTDNNLEYVSPGEKESTPFKRRLSPYFVQIHADHPLLDSEQQPPSQPKNST